MADLVADLVRYEVLGSTWPAVVQSWARRVVSGTVRTYITVETIRPSWGVVPPESIADLEWPADAPPLSIGQVVHVVLYREHWHRWEQVEFPFAPFPLTRVVIEGVYALHFSGREPEPEADQPIIIEQPDHSVAKPRFS